MGNATPSHNLPIKREAKALKGAQVRAIIEQANADLVLRHLMGRCINIHHAVLAGFMGAKPYRHAYKRGVKVIGVTSHYITSDLDEVAIIARDV